MGVFGSDHREIDGKISVKACDFVFAWMPGVINLDLREKSKVCKLRCSWPNCKKSFDPPTHPVKKIGGGAEVVTV